MLSIKILFFALWLTVASSMAIGETRTCLNNKNNCFLKTLKCPAECPSTAPKDVTAKVCNIDCNSPICKAECKRRKPNSNDPGAVVFHGRHDEHFSLVSDVNFQINARYVGQRQAERSRDYSRVQALGVLFNQNTFTLEATHAANWRDDAVKHLKFAYNEYEITVPEGHLSRWESSDSEIIVERLSDANNILITVSDFAEVSVSVFPVTKEEDMVHNYQIQENDCSAHLEVHFKFYGLSLNVEGVLGRSYQPELRNPAKPGVAMPVVGGEEKYRTASLLSPKCSSCTYSPAEDRLWEDVFSNMHHVSLEYAGGVQQESNIL